ncbi:MAG: MFS transporter [Candidatus Heimdallarchaeota archaeon]|nr:MFS transporter [Candidatus Heimdallarchaeota archaeon]MDH5644533.1 MFS transporter [Candidatus Heimdallarchaeota archaeon]
MGTSKGNTNQISKLDFSEIKHYKTNIFAWSLYDLANTIYSMGVVSLTIAPLIILLTLSENANIDPSTLISSEITLSRVQFEDGVELGGYYFAGVLLIGNLVMAFLSPLLGAYADQLSKRKYFLSLITIFCLIFTFSLGLKLNLTWVLITFFFANLTYQMSLVVYDSMLPFLAKPNEVSKAAGFGVAFGYFGSYIAIALSMYLAGNNNDYILDEKNYIIKIGYIPSYFSIVAFAFLIFGIPLLLVKEVRPQQEKIPFRETMKNTFASLKLTAHEVFQYKDTRNFMVGWLLFIDMANTVIAFMSIIITIGLGLPAEEVTLVLAIGITSAVLFTFPIGWIGDKIGPKKLFYLIGILWILSIILTIFTNLTIGGVTTPKELAYLNGLVVGPALGGGWVAQRLMITELSPEDRTSNYFGFTNIFGRISSAIGPYIWTGSIWLLNRKVGFDIGDATRYTLIVLGILLISGIYLISRVTDHHDKYLAGARHIGDGIWVDNQGNQID